MERRFPKAPFDDLIKMFPLVGYASRFEYVDDYGSRCMETLSEEEKERRTGTEL